MTSTGSTIIQARMRCMNDKHRPEPLTALFVDRSATSSLLGVWPSRPDPTLLTSPPVGSDPTYDTGGVAVRRLAVSSNPRFALEFLRRRDHGRPMFQCVVEQLHGYVLDKIGDAGSGVFVVDETGFLNKGVRSTGVARRYTGTSGKID